MKRFYCLGLLFSLLVSVGCRSAVYSAWEKVGVYKRDLLKEAVVEARDEQEEAGEQFKDALTRIQEMYQFEGGNLEKTYNGLKRDYDRSNEKAQDVRKRIRDMETVAADLFQEWEKEMKEISSSELRAGSRRQLGQTREHYEQMHEALKRAERSMEPVLTQFRDHVLYLKHNLNAAAIASLKGEAAGIETDISRLLDEMNRSIDEANRFIKTLE